MRVDNLLSLYYSLALLPLLRIFFRKADFRGGEIPVETTPRSEASVKLHLRPGLVYLVRGLGVANMVLGFVGIVFACADVVTTYVHRSVLSRSGFSFKVSLIGAAIDLGFVAGLFFAGYLLVKLDRRGMVLTNFILIAEIVFSFVSRGTPALKSFTHFGLTPQLLTAYPLFALPLLYWGARRLNQCQAWKRRAVQV
jgi:ABC-type glycerol-3-phosphate transport system permease component